MYNKKREFKKLLKYNRRHLVRLAKKATPWDYESCLKSLIGHLIFMKEYYRLGYNIYCEDDERYDTICKAIDEFNMWSNCDRKYYLEDGIYEDGEFKGLPKFKPLFEDEEENSRALENEKLSHWNNFWTIIKTEMQYWWD